MDALHNAHWDCKGRGETALFLGRGDVPSYSNKLKSNTGSSTENQLVGADRYILQRLWYLYFIQEQGYDVEHIKLHQDNILAQLLEINGDRS